MDLNYPGMVIHYEYEDTELIFRDVSYDEEAEELSHHNENFYYNLSMRNVLNYVIHPIKYQNIFNMHIYHSSLG